MTAGDVSEILTNNSHRPALVCDGTNDYGEIDESIVALVASGNTTGAIMGWIKPLGHTDTGCMYSGGDFNIVEHLNFGIENGKLHAEMKNATVMQWDIDSTDVMDFTDNKWHHIALVMHGARPTMYFDGVAVAMTDTTTTDLNAWFDELTGGDVGALGVLTMNGTQTLDFDGGISGVKIYDNIVLTADEIYDEFANGNANIRAGGLRKQLIATALVNHWVCDDLTDDGTGNDPMVLTNNAVNHLYYSDVVQKLNDAYTHANDQYIPLVTDAGGNGTFGVLIVHGA